MARPAPDINSFLAGLAAPAERPAERPADQPPQPADSSNKRLKANNEAGKEATELPSEASGLNTQQTVLRLWVKKRTMMNEPGIAAALTQIDRLPEPGEAIHSIMGGDYNGFDLIPAIQRMTGKPLAGLKIATLSFSLKNILQLARMIDEGHIEGPVTLLASMFFARSDPSVFRQSREQVEARGGRLIVARNHAKIMATRSGDDWIVCETSANLRSCVSLEQFSLTNDRRLYDFHAGWIDRVANNAETNPTEENEAFRRP